MSVKRTVIHRDGTFEYCGKLYRVLKNGPSAGGDGYEILTADYDAVADGFAYLSDIRDYVDEARQNRWPLFEEKDRS